MTAPARGTEERPKGLSRRTVVGSLAVAAVATACLGDGPDDAAEGAAGTSVPDRLALEGDPDAPLVDDAPDPPRNDGAESTTTTVAPLETTTTERSTSTTAARSATSTTLLATTMAPTTAAPGTAAPSTTAAPSATTTAAPKPTMPETTAAPTTTTTPPPPVADPGLILTRLSFGASRDLDLELTTSTEAEWLDRQLTLAGPDPTVEATIDANFAFAGTTIPEAFALHEATEGKRLRRELVLSNVLRATFSTHQVYEMLVHLWMDHFNVNIEGTYKLTHLAWHYQEDVIRANAMGTFHDLLVATAHSPAMMVYLDNYRSDANRANGVNENYGRELLELHTLGIEQDGSHIYTETDVVAASLIMSGWGIVYDHRNSPATHSTFRYDDSRHHSGTVDLLGGQFSTAGTSGKASGDALLAFLSHHPQTARYVAFKLIRRFVTDTPPESLIASAAQVYLANDTAIVPTLRHILDSAPFATSAGAKLRRPFEHVVAALRATGSSLPVDPMGDTANDLVRLLEDLDHEPWQWDQPDGFPDTADPWLSSDGMLTRWALSAEVARGRLGSDDDIEPDLGRLAGSAATVDELLDHLAVVAGLRSITGGEKSGLAAALGTDLGTPVADLAEGQLEELAGFVFAHPRFQVR